MSASIPEILSALDTLPGDPDTLARVRSVVVSFGNRSTRKSERLRVALAMLSIGTPRRDANTALKLRFGVSRRTAERDVNEALKLRQNPTFCVAFQGYGVGVTPYWSPTWKP